MSSLYQRTHEPLEKTAGTRISKSPNQWNVEILKTLVNEHPYIGADEAKIKMDRLDPEKKESSGRVIIRDKLAIPFSIAQNEETDQVEIDPMDIIFIPDPSGDDGRLRHLNENSYKEALQEEAVGQPYPPEGEEEMLPPGNNYVGDLTGDVSPLEYSGRGMMQTASCGLLSSVIREGDQLSRLHHLLNDYRGVSLSAQRLGLHDTLENLEAGTIESSDRDNVVQIRAVDHNQLVLETPNGHQRPISAVELREALPNRHEDILRQVMSRGWAIIRDFPVIKAPEVPVVNTMPSPVEEGGWYHAVSQDGASTRAIICPMMMDFDGQSIKEQAAISEDHGFDRGKVFCGTPIEEPIRQHPAGDSRMTTGKTGVFLREAFGSCQATPRVAIEKMIEPPDEPPMLIGGRQDTLESIGIVLVDALTRPERIRHPERIDAALPDQSFYLPASYTFIETRSDAEFLDEAARDEAGTSDERPVARLRKNANWYSLHGRVEKEGEITERMLSENDMRMKLASLSADDHVIERACQMDDQEELDLHGLRPSRLQLKTADQNISADPAVLSQIKRGAQEALEGYNTWMKTAQAEEQEDPQTLDAILSLQFVSDDSLQDIIQSESLFANVEDKLSRLLLAARRGEEAIHEKGVQRALKGMGAVRKSLKTLKIELDDRGMI